MDANTLPQVVQETLGGLQKINTMKKENTKKIKTLNDKFKETLDNVGNFMTQHNLPCVPFGNGQYVIWKVKKSAPTMNDELLAAICRSYFNKVKSQPITEEDVRDFMQYVQTVKVKLTVTKKVIEISDSIPYEVVV